MTAAKYDITIEKGTTFIQEFVYKDSNSQIIDLTGYTARMQVRQSEPSSTTIFNLTDVDGITIAPLEGKLSVRIEAADTASISAITAVYDLEIEATDGTVTRLVEGKVAIKQEVTR